MTLTRLVRKAGYKRTVDRAFLAGVEVSLSSNSTRNCLARGLGFDNKRSGGEFPVGPTVWRPVPCIVRAQTWYSFILYSEDEIELTAVRNDPP